MPIDNVTVTEVVEVKAGTPGEALSPLAGKAAYVCDACGRVLAIYDATVPAPKMGPCHREPTKYWAASVRINPATGLAIAGQLVE